MIEICSGKKSIPFIAEGPSSQILREMKTVWELSIAIKKAIGTDCHNPECVNRQKRDGPPVSRAPIEISSQKLPVRSRKLYLMRVLLDTRKQ